MFRVDERSLSAHLDHNETQNTIFSSSAKYILIPYLALIVLLGLSST